jgi:host factor-I protein
MAVELDTGLPSTRQIQTLIREEQSIELKLLTGDLVSGKVRWQDPNCICLTDPQGQTTLIWRQAIAYVKPQH